MSYRMDPLQACCKIQLHLFNEFTIINKIKYARA